MLTNGDHKLHNVKDVPGFIFRSNVFLYSKIFLKLVDGRVQCYSLKGLKAETHTCYIASLCGGIIWTSWIMLAAMHM